MSSIGKITGTVCRLTHNDGFKRLSLITRRVWVATQILLLHPTFNFRPITRYPDIRPGFHGRRDGHGCPCLRAHFYAYRCGLVSRLPAFACFLACQHRFRKTVILTHHLKKQTLLIPAHWPKPRHICICFHKTATRVSRFLSNVSCMKLHSPCSIELSLRFLLV